MYASILDWRAKNRKHIQYSFMLIVEQVVSERSFRRHEWSGHQKQRILQTHRSYSRSLTGINKRLA